jgi:hypothetical protein
LRSWRQRPNKKTKLAKMGLEKKNGLWYNDSITKTIGETNYGI